MESLCMEKKKKREGKNVETLLKVLIMQLKIKQIQCDYGARLCGYIFQNMFMEFLKKKLSLPGSRKFQK